MVIGVFIIFCILDIVDFFVEGVFFMGVVVCVLCIVNDINLIVVIIVGMLGGMLVGLVLGFFYIKMKILVFFIGIIMLIGFYFINLFVLGRLNVFFVFKNILVIMVIRLGLNKFLVVLLIGIVCVGLVILILYFFLNI